MSRIKDYISDLDLMLAPSDIEFSDEDIERYYGDDTERLNEDLEWGCKDGSDYYGRVIPPHALEKIIALTFDYATTQHSEAATAHKETVRLLFRALGYNEQWIRDFVVPMLDDMHANLSDYYNGD